MGSPFLDVSDVLLDPELADSFSVTRRVESVSTHGRSVVTPSTYNGIIGVITMAGSNDLLRLDDNQRMGRNIVIVTKFRLRGPATGYQPDTITWLNDTYVVKYVDVYTKYGAGFIQAIAGSMDSMDSAP